MIRVPGVNTDRLVELWEQQHGRIGSDSDRAVIVGVLESQARLVDNIRTAIPDLEGERLAEGDGDGSRTARSPAWHSAARAVLEQALREARRQNVKEQQAV